MRVYSERFRDPVGARTGRDTYRTFALREIPGSNPETRRATADDYTLETVDTGHFVFDERPDLVRRS